MMNGTMPSVSTWEQGEALLDTRQFPDIAEFTTELCPEIFARDPTSPTAVVPDQDSARTLSPLTPSFSDIGDASLKELLGAWGEEYGAAAPSPSPSRLPSPALVKIKDLACNVKQEPGVRVPPQPTKTTPKPKPKPRSRPRDNAKISPRVQKMFPRETLRCSADEWKTYRKKIRALTKDEQQQVSVLRRKELSCVYAENARQRRIRSLREFGKDNAKLSSELAQEKQKSASLARELAWYKAKFG